MYIGIFEILEFVFFKSFIGKCMFFLFCRFVYDFYIFIEYMFLVYVVDFGYCLFGKRLRYFYFLFERFLELFL